MNERGLIRKRECVLGQPLFRLCSLFVNEAPYPSESPAPHAQAPAK